MVLFCLVTTLVLAEPTRVYVNTEVSQPIVNESQDSIISPWVMPSLIIIFLLIILFVFLHLKKNGKLVNSKKKKISKKKHKRK
jgi:fucose permease